MPKKRRSSKVPKQDKTVKAGERLLGKMPELTNPKSVRIETDKGEIVTASEVFHKDVMLYFSGSKHRRRLATESERERYFKELKKEEE